MVTSPPWSDLPDDVLKTLVAFLLPNFFDVLSFEAVCKSWRAAAAALRSKETIPRHPRGPPLPCLAFRRSQGEVIAAAAGGGDEAAAAAAAAATATARCFHSLANDRVYRRDQVPGESCDWECRGSSQGWLLMLDPHGAAFLFNPITGGRVGLPPVTTLPGAIRIGKSKRDGAPLYIFLSPPLYRDHPERRRESRFCRLTADKLRHGLVEKLALSSSPSDPDCVAMVIYDAFHTLAYARPGDKSWTELQNPWNKFKDVIYHAKEGRFYALSDVAGVVAIDFPSAKVEGGRLPPPAMKVVAPKAQGDAFWRPRNEYLVVLPSGEILRVRKFVDFYDPSDDDDEVGGQRDGGDEDDRDVDDSDPEYEDGNEDNEYSSDSDSEHGYVKYALGTYRTASFKVFKLDASGEGAEKKQKNKKFWLPLSSIGECSLFLGFNQSMSLPASSKVMGKYRPNCIYFTDDTEQSGYGGHDCGIFEIGKETLEFFFPLDTPKRVPPPMWIMPNLWGRGG